MFEQLLSHEVFNSPVVILILLFLGTFVLEDAAIIAGVMLVHRGAVSADTTFLALLLGIVVGDLLLYGCGFLSGKIKRLQKWRTADIAKRTNLWFHRNALLTIFLVRFAPGLRLPCYLSCGWFFIPLKTFILGVSAAGCLWMTLVFGGLLWGGEPLWNHPVLTVWIDKTGFGQWFLLSLLVGILYVVQWCLKGIIRAYLERK